VFGIVFIRSYYSTYHDGGSDQKYSDPCLWTRGDDGIDPRSAEGAGEEIGKFDEE
jgi:hypothetical protein